MKLNGSLGGIRGIIGRGLIRDFFVEHVGVWTLRSHLAPALICRTASSEHEMPGKDSKSWLPASDFPKDLAIFIYGDTILSPGG